MAVALTVSSQFTRTLYRSEALLGSNEEQGRGCARKTTSLSKTSLGSERLLGSGCCKSWQPHSVTKRLPCLLALPGGEFPDDESDSEEEGASSNDSNNINSEIFREQMERMLDSDDADFRGKDLATLIRKKYGRSYDVQFIKKEFMGRQLLAMNVMWKYREQRSFPLTEEEYLLHLDDIANTLKGWGAVSHIRSSLAKTKERPRIGKAVSIVIDLDEFGGRAKEWINR